MRHRNREVRVRQVETGMIVILVVRVILVWWWGVDTGDSDEISVVVVIASMGEIEVMAVKAMIVMMLELN